VRGKRRKKESSKVKAELATYLVSRMPIQWKRNKIKFRPKKNLNCCSKLLSLHLAFNVKRIQLLLSV